jgi:hypothetical protein
MLKSKGKQECSHHISVSIANRGGSDLGLPGLKQDGTGIKQSTKPS